MWFISSPSIHTGCKARRFSVLLSLVPETNYRLDFINLTLPILLWKSEYFFLQIIKFRNILVSCFPIRLIEIWDLSRFVYMRNCSHSVTMTLNHFNTPYGKIDLLLDLVAKRLTGMFWSQDWPVFIAITQRRKKRKLKKKNAFWDHHSKTQVQIIAHWVQWWRV